MSSWRYFDKLLLRWVKIVGGQSYYHQPQGLGRLFVPSKLRGYFNDLTGKTQWSGENDPEGIPLNVLVNGRRTYFATTIAQKALGHWDNWLMTDNPADKVKFLQLSKWLLSKQDDRGGWPVWLDLGLSLSSPYNAMTQGQCISVFVRAYSLEGKAEYLESSIKAFALMRIPVQHGGVMIESGEDLFLEETPVEPRTTILNGWVFALFGIYDLLLSSDNSEAREIFTQSLSTLKKHISDYDNSYWSCYDVRGHIASPFYHDLHISQLKALAQIDHDPIWNGYSQKWMRYRNKSTNKTKAFVIKAIQKLKEPGEAVIIR